MPNLPAQYAWLGREPAPNHPVQARKLFGTVETPGIKNNPVMLAWADEVGVDGVYVAGSRPWCGLFAAIAMNRVGWDAVTNPLWALNWSKFGQKADKPMLGDILTLTRIGEDTSVGAPAGGQTGSILEDVAKAVDLALFPLQFTAAVQVRFRAFLDRTVGSIPEDRRVAPLPRS